MLVYHREVILACEPDMGTLHNFIVHLLDTTTTNIEVIEELMRLTDDLIAHYPPHILLSMISSGTLKQHHRNQPFALFSFPACLALNKVDSDWRLIENHRQKSLWLLDSNNSSALSPSSQSTGLKRYVSGIFKSNAKICPMPETQPTTPMDTYVGTGNNNVDKRKPTSLISSSWIVFAAGAIGSGLIGLGLWKSVT